MDVFTSKAQDHIADDAKKKVFRFCTRSSCGKDPQLILTNQERESHQPIPMNQGSKEEHW